MATGPIFKTLVVAALAAGVVWLVTMATFPAGPYVDNRPYCSGMITIPCSRAGWSKVKDRSWNERESWRFDRR